MIFITLGKYRGKPTKAMEAEAAKGFARLEKEGIKNLGQYWALGRYDFISIAEAKDEKTFMKAALQWGDMIHSETLVAVPRDEAVKLVE